MEQAAQLTELADLQQKLLVSLSDADSDLQLYSAAFEQLSLVDAVEKLPQAQRALYLQQQHDWLAKAIDLLKAERENVVTALEKIQLAKKVKASYHTVQKG